MTDVNKTNNIINNNNDKIVNVAITLTGKKKKLIKGMMVDTPTSYSTLITLPIVYETEVNGKTIVDESLYDYTLNKIKDKFSKDNVRDTLIHLYDSGGGQPTRGVLRDDNETSLDKKLERKGMFKWNETNNPVEYESKVEISYGRYTGNYKFDKVSNGGMTTRASYDDSSGKYKEVDWSYIRGKYDWLSILSFTTTYETTSLGRKFNTTWDDTDCSEEYINLIWSVWNKHIDGNIKEYPVYFAIGKSKPKKLITGTIKGITKYDAIQKYENNETDIEDVRYVSYDEVAEDSIQLGKIQVSYESIEPNIIPKENDLLSINKIKKEFYEKFK